MKFQIFKNKKQRLKVKDFEKKRKILLFLQKNLFLQKKINYIAAILLTKLKNNTIKNRIKNRCILTGSSKSISRKYKISRISLKYLIFFKKISGITKYSW